MRGLGPALALLLAAWLPGAAAACGGAAPCVLAGGAHDGRTYHVLAPEGWDGTAPLPVLMHFHGWGRQGDLIVRHARIAGATAPAGVLLVAPDGLGRSWRFRRAGSEDVAFGDAVLRDVAARWPVDPGRVMVSGYSWGALMAWRFACEAEAPLAALLSVAGALPAGTDCPRAPRSVRAVYGTDDKVLPFPWGPDGDETGPVALWRARLGCGAQAAPRDWAAVSWLTHTRHGWDCAGGRVTLDVHPASHLIPRGWFAQVLGEALD